MSEKLLRFPDIHSQHSDVARRPAPSELPHAAQLAEALGEGERAADSGFDRYLSSQARALSTQHWTPLAVASRAADWLDEFNIRTVLDVGSGAGKFCVAAALAGHCHFTGLEHRKGLVACARSLARTFKVERRVHFIHGALGTVRLPEVDAYYFYNPFEENVLGDGSRIDADVELSPQRYSRDLVAVRELLNGARSGTYVLTYNGLGGKLPATYRSVCIDRGLPNVLRLWRKAVPRMVVGQGDSASDQAR